MESTEAADLLAALAGTFILTNFLLFEAEVFRVQASGLLVGTVVAAAGFYNVYLNHARQGGTDQINHAAIIMGMWMAFLTMFWKTSPHTEFVALTGGAVMAISSAYASYRRQNPMVSSILKAVLR